MVRKRTTTNQRPIELELASIVTALRQVVLALKDLDKHLTKLEPQPPRSGPIYGPSPFLNGEQKRRDGTEYAPLGSKPPHADDTGRDLRSPKQR